MRQQLVIVDRDDLIPHVLAVACGREPRSDSHRKARSQALAMLIGLARVAVSGIDIIVTPVTR